MKKYRQHQYFSVHILIILSALLIFASCYRYPEFDDITYNEYNRVIGPEGGVINFYRNYQNDSVKDIAVSLDFPENAVDSLIIINMYEFFDNVTYNSLFVDLNIDQFSDFLYFVPFYESEGYKAVVTDSTNIDSIIQKHTDINFNAPVKVKYFNTSFNEIPDSIKLYKIKIPAENEWGEENNVWVKYNYQGYPDGYYDIDLIYLITGRWTQSAEWGTGNLSSANWEEVSGFSYNPIDNSVDFNIYGTDYMYVMAVK